MIGRIEVARIGGISGEQEFFVLFCGFSQTKRHIYFKMRIGNGQKRQNVFLFPGFFRKTLQMGSLSKNKAIRDKPLLAMKMVRQPKLEMSF